MSSLADRPQLGVRLQRFLPVGSVQGLLRVVLLVRLRACKYRDPALLVVRVTGSSEPRLAQAA